LRGRGQQSGGGSGLWRRQQQAGEYHHIDANGNIFFSSSAIGFSFISFFFF